MDNDKEINIRIIRVKLIDGTQISGQININKGSAGYDRLSDLIGDTKESFLVVFGATSYQKDHEESVKNRVMFLNKRHILWALPDEDQK